MELILAAVINGAFALLILIVGKKLNGKIDSVSNDLTATKRAVHETKNEVKNSHTINFRDDMDSKFRMTNGLIRGVQETQARHGRDIIQLRNSVSEHIESQAQRDQEVREELVAFRRTLREE